jgi:hypothetical protein
MRKIALLIILLATVSSGGCGGYYILTVPDQLGRKNGSVVPVARLQRNDFFILALAVRDMPIRFRVYPAGTAPRDGELPRPNAKCGLERISATDENGYAAIRIPTLEPPICDRPGKYDLNVSLQDSQEGEEISAVVPVFLWDYKKSAIAVDYDCLPPETFGEEADAAAAVCKLASKANILYLTSRKAQSRESYHDRLTRGGFPDGPVLQWQRERWRVVKDKRFKYRVVIETRLVSQLQQLTVAFPKLNVGVCRSDLAAKAFVNAGMKCIVINNQWIKGSKLEHRESWADLTAKGAGP